MSEQLQTLRILEEQLQQVMQQKRSYNRQVMEVENALQEISVVEDAYHIVGNVMVKKSSSVLTEQLNKKKDIANVRLQTLDKQEKELEKEVQELQKQVMQELDNN